MAITARKPKQKTCPACGKQVNRKNYARHHRKHKENRWPTNDKVGDNVS